MRSGFAMKRLLQRILNQGQYRALLRFKNKTIPNLRYRLGQSPFLLVGSVIKVLPASSKVTLKSSINVVKKMDYKRRDIFLTVDSDIEYRVRLNSCKKEPDTVEWIETSLKEGDVLYDVGANTGAYSLVTSKCFDGKVQVFAFEPAFLNYAQLCKNLVINQCGRSVIPFQIALSDQTGIEDFNYHVLVPGGAVHALGEAVDHEGEAFKPASTQPVIRYRLDDFVRQFGIPAPNHVKIDVDGTEFSILKGMDETLSNPSLRSLMLELNEGRGQVTEIVDFLSAKGLEERSRLGSNRMFERRNL